MASAVIHLETGSSESKDSHSQKPVSPLDISVSPIPISVRVVPMRNTYISKEVFIAI